MAAWEIMNSGVLGGQHLSVFKFNTVKMYKAECSKVHMAKYTNELVYFGSFNVREGIIHSSVNKLEFFFLATEKNFLRK